MIDILWFKIPHRIGWPSDATTDGEEEERFMPQRRRPFVERRGDRLRVRWSGPDGKLLSASRDDAGQPFEDEVAAEQYGWEQLGKIDRGEWTDPDAVAITVNDWVNMWWPAQDLGRRTVGNYRWFIEAFILPAFGERLLVIKEKVGLTTLEISAWEVGIKEDGYDTTTAAKARSVFITILNDAVPAHLPMNPAARPPRPRGRRSGRRNTGRRGKVWPSPLEALLVAERIAVLTGRDEDFVLGITFGWTGTRWAEAIGMQEEFLHQDFYELDWQLQEAGGKFYREPLKTDSYRTHDDDDGISRVDLPPFLHELLKWVVDTNRGGRCCNDSCHCGGDRWIFLGPKGGHYYRNNAATRMWRPACDGIYPAQNRGRGKEPAKPVLVDATNWPGRPLQAWPAAIPGEPFEPPPVGQGKGRSRIPDGTPLASWLPIKTGLTPHGLRHGHNTWMAEDGIPDVLRKERLGHRLPGMAGRYTHISDQMRKTLVDALEQRWRIALKERQELAAISPVPLLAKLLKET